MRILMIAAAVLLSGCASAVYDSLDRRGVDSRAVLAARVDELRADAAGARARFAEAAAALEDVEGRSGPELARRIDVVRGAGERAALAAQDLRLAAESMEAAGGRYFAAREKEIRLRPAGVESSRAAAALAAERRSYEALSATLAAALLRLSPALSLYDREAAALRRDPTSAVAAATHARERAAAVAATQEATRGLDAAAAAAAEFRSLLT
jgi:hypothetical protein